MPKFHMKPLALLLLAASWVDATPVISEFLAENSGASQLDEDLFPADWIEILNTLPNPISLTGYSLTDDAANLTKWTFPDTTLAGNERLLVFASGKDRKVSGSPLHTNFSLSNNGEFLALVQPDGATLQSSFGLEYPPQYEDVSYGNGDGSQISNQDLLSIGAPLTYLIPTEDIGSSWQEPGFDDSSWSPAHSAVGWGYSTSVGATIPADGDLRSVMQGENASVYLRLPFQINDLNSVQEMVLRMKVDDGFVAYLNGERIADKNDRVPLLFNSTASGNEEVRVGDPFENFTVAFADKLVEGENILAIQGMNGSAGSSDFIIIPELAVQLESVGVLGELGYLPAPTPESPNGGSRAAAPEEVKYDVASRAFTDDFNLTLSHENPEAVIRYTTDGSLPTNSLTGAAHIYSDPIEIDESTLVRARAFVSGALDGEGRSEGYFKMAASEDDFSSDLPVVLLTTFGTGSPPASSSSTRNDTFMLIYEPDPATGRTTLSGTPSLSTRGGFRKRGSSSANFPKYSMSFESWDEFDEDKDIEPLGFSPEGDWILNARYTFDLALMRNPFLYELSNQIGQWAVGTRFVELYNDVNGGELSGNDYFGVYTFMEKIEPDNNRVDISKLDPWENTPEERTGGYIFKSDRPDPDEPTFSVSGFQRAMVHVDPDGIDISSTQKSYLTDYTNDLTEALREADGIHPTTGLHFTDYLDVDSFIDHFWLNLLAMDPDWGRLSQFFHKDRGGKIIAGPIWDYDRTMGSRDGRDDNPLRWEANTSDTSFAWFDNEYEWFGLLFGFTTADNQVRNMPDPQLRTNRADVFQKVIDRWYSLRGDRFGEGNLDEIIDGMATQLSESQARNFTRWTALNPGTITGNNYASPGLTGWEREVSHLKGWLKTRAEWIDDQFFSPPSFSQNGGEVDHGFQLNISTSQGSVYFTLDGSDPREAGGTISAGAINATNATINETSIVTARAHDGQQWGAPRKAVFVVGADLATDQNLVISEIMYDPADPSAFEMAAGFTDTSQFEYLKITNISNQAVNLTEVSFTEGLDFAFIGNALTRIASGKSILIVRNQAAFLQRYGVGLASDIAGEFSNDSGLSGKGERLVLTGPNGVINDLTYNNKYPWPESPDGHGPSLVLIQPGTNPSEGIATNWRPSVDPNGSPGVTHTLEFGALNPIADQDRDGLTAFMEYALGTSDQFEDFEPVVSELDSKGRFTATYQRDLRADEAIIFLEYSADLQSWMPLDSTFTFDEETHSASGIASYKYRTVDAAAEGKKLFVRLRVMGR